jgi:LPS-assembly lipoprotein
MRARLALVALLAVLPGCSLHPLYAGGGGGRTALEDRVGRGDGAAVYRLEVELDDNITGFGIRSDDAVTRERRSLRARYRLVDAARGTVLLDATAGSDAGVDVVSSEYATMAAEQTALEHLAVAIADQIVSRVALYASRGGRPPAAPTAPPAPAAR